MKKLNLTLSQQITALALTILVLYSITNIISFMQFHSVNISVTELTEAWLPNIVRAGELKSELTQLNEKMSQLLFTSNKDSQKQLIENIETIKGNLFIYGKMLGEGISDREYLNELEKFNEFSNQYLESTDSLMTYLNSDEKNLALKLFQNEMSAQYAKASDHLKKISDLSFNASQNTRKNLIEATENKKITIISIGISVLVSGLLISYIFGQYIAKKIKYIASSLSEGSNSIYDSSYNLAKLAHSVTSSATEQSSAVQETISSLKEMDNMISKTTAAIKAFSEKAKSAKQQSDQGKSVVDKLIVNMGELERTNDQLQDISKVIDHIYQQTQVINSIVLKTQLLSFNASIEAARAGQNGRGFAVVAAEVGQLALSSSKAAQDIENLIQSSQIKVKNAIESIQEKSKESHDISYQTLENFSKITNEIDEINLQMETITDASYKQEIAIKESYSAMKELDKAALLNTQSSAEVLRMSDHMKLESDQLKLQTSQLIEVVSHEKNVS